MAAIAALELPFVRRTPANLADDSTIFVEVYEAMVLWHGARKVVSVLATGRLPLLGMLLLDGSDLNIQVASGGLVLPDLL